MTLCTYCIKLLKEANRLRSTTMYDSKSCQRCGNELENKGDA